MIKDEKRGIFCSWLAAWIILMFFFIGDGAAAPAVTVTGSNRNWSDAVILALSDFLPYAEILDTTDPNFKRDGKRRFKGIPLTRLLKMAGLEKNHGLTVIGSDQYVGYLTPERITQGMLVWEMDGVPISGLKGGPLKMMFPADAGVHASCFTWYVTALVQDRPAGDTLTVVTRGRETRYPFSDLVSAAAPLPAGLVSIAQGCRNEFSEAGADKPARAVPLSRLVKALSQAESVTLEPYFGQPIRLRPQALAHDALIVVSCGSKTLHPALGGPYSIIFPVEAHHELSGMVPESGAFFFLKAIVVE